MTSETLAKLNGYDLRLFLGSVNVLLERGIRPTSALEYINKIEDEPLRELFRKRLFDSVSPEDAERIQKIIDAQKVIEENNHPLSNKP